MDEREKWKIKPRDKEEVLGQKGWKEMKRWDEEKKGREKKKKVERIIKSREVIFYLSQTKVGITM